MILDRNDHLARFDAAHLEAFGDHMAHDLFGVFGRACMGILHDDAIPGLADTDADRGGDALTGCVPANLGVDAGHEHAGSERPHRNHAGAFWEYTRYTNQVEVRDPSIHESFVERVEIGRTFAGAGHGGDGARERPHTHRASSRWKHAAAVAFGCYAYSTRRSSFLPKTGPWP